MESKLHTDSTIQEEVIKMARAARKFSESGIYHIVFRGVNRQHLFEEEADYEKLRKILAALKEEMKYQIYAYCFMSNHVHILLKEQNVGDISLIMKRLLTKYARWYNIKYKRSGALIANRYKSKPVEIDEYFLPVVRYIHQNPTKAGITSSMEEYSWSSYNEYIMERDELTDIAFVMDILPKKEFIEFHQEEDDSMYDVDDRVKISDDEIRRIILKEIGAEPKNIDKMEKEQRDEILRKLKNKFSIRQLERVTGISRGVIYKS